MQFNKVLIGGNLTRDPELIYTAAGTALCKFGMAMNETFTSNGEKREKTTFVDVVAWGKTAEIIAKHVTQGQPLFIEGKLDYSTWKDKTTGGNRSKLEIKVETFKFIGPKVDRPDVAAKAVDRKDADAGTEIPF